jgi:hypothetical protein
MKMNENELKTKEHELLIELESVRAQIEQIRLDKIRQQCGVYLGCKVISKGQLYLVSEIEDYFNDKKKGWVSGRRFKKDGTPSLSKSCLYSDWELVEE